MKNTCSYNNDDCYYVKGKCHFHGNPIGILTEIGLIVLSLALIAAIVYLCLTG